MKHELGVPLRVGLSALALPAYTPTANAAGRSSNKASIPHAVSGNRAHFPEKQKLGKGLPKYFFKKTLLCIA